MPRKPHVLVLGAALLLLAGCIAGSDDDRPGSNGPPTAGNGPGDTAVGTESTEPAGPRDTAAGTERTESEGPQATAGAGGEDPGGQTGEEGSGAAPACLPDSEHGIREQTPLGPSGAELLAAIEGPFEATVRWQDGSSSALTITRAPDEYFEERFVQYEAPDEPRCPPPHLSAGYGVELDSADGRLAELAWGDIQLFGDGRATFWWSSEEMYLGGTLDITAGGPDAAEGSGDCAVDIDEDGVEQRSCSRGTLNLRLDYEDGATHGELQVVPRWQNESFIIGSW